MGVNLDLSIMNDAQRDEAQTDLEKVVERAKKQLEAFKSARIGVPLPKEVPKTPTPAVEQVKIPWVYPELAESER